jgi:transposase
VERLPGFAPDLNPVEGLWANLKGVELANLAADTVQEITTAAEYGINASARPITWPTRFFVTAASPPGEQ